MIRFAAHTHARCRLHNFFRTTRSYFHRRRVNELQKTTVSEDRLYLARQSFEIARLQLTNRGRAKTKALGNVCRDYRSCGADFSSICTWFGYQTTTVKYRASNCVPLGETAAIIFRK